MSNTILKLPQVKEATGKSRTSIYTAIKEGTFPAPVAIGARSVGWSSAAIEKWIDDRINVAITNARGNK